jgi:two-component system, cell cycle sensor histidine kinase and response regulator CckA
MGALQSGRHVRSEGSPREEALLHALLEAAADVAGLRDADGVMVEVFCCGNAELTAAARRCVGRSPEDVFPPETAHAVVRTVKATLETGRPQVLEYDAVVDGVTYTLRATTSVMRTANEDAPLVVWLAREVTAEARARQDASLILDSLNAQVWHVDRGGRVEYMNRAAAELCGVRAEDAHGRPVQELVTRLEGLQHHNQQTADVLRSGQPALGELRSFVVDGRTQWFSVDKIPVMRGGETTGLVVFGYDVTPQHEAEERYRLLTEELELRVRERTARLRESQELFESFMKNAPFAAFIKKGGRYVYANDAFQETLAPLGGWRSKTDADLWGEAEAADLAERDATIARTGLPHTSRRHVRTAQGQRTWLKTRFLIARATGEPLIGGIGIDVTERTLLEEQLVQAQKMESIGRLAGGIAHDFNNLLTVINAHGHFMGESLGPQHEVAEDLHAMLDAAQRAATLTRQLLIFARQEPSNVRTVDLHELTMGLDKLLRRVLGDDIELTTVPNANVDPVEVDPRQMDQVLMNLAVNARDAMPDGGRIVIATRRLLVTPEMAEARPGLPTGPCVELTMTDTGIGMDRETLSRMFEPFFTTKSEGKGTGLGLATSYGIIKRFEGHIWAESAPGHGTTFHIVIPSSKGAVRSKSIAAPAQAHGRETILMVEDNDLVREAVGRGLERFGYTVLSARSGLEALRIAETARFDLLVTDVNMPGMNGFELVGHVREMAPRTKVLFVSGYVEETPSRKDIRALPGVELLVKPFTPKALANKLRAMFDAP